MGRFFPYLLSSLRHYWRTNLGVITGAVIATAVLVGALIAGDSVRTSLLNLSMKRLGKTHHALVSDHGTFRSELATLVARNGSVTSSGLLHLSGSLQTHAQQRLNQVQVWGIDEHFHSFAPGIGFPADISGNRIAVSRRVADLLELEIDHELILSVENNAILPLESPVVSKANRSIQMAVEVAAVLEDDQLGRFSLRSNQFVPNNIFMDRELLAGKTGSAARINTIICQSRDGLSTEQLNRSLKEVLAPEDLNLSLRELPELGRIELISDQIFLNHRISRAMSEVSSVSEKVLSYFVNEISGHDLKVPYSFVAGMSRLDTLVLEGDEIVLNDWTAQELRVIPGDSVRLSYYALDARNELVQREHAFLLKQIVPIAGAAADPHLMPAFPGLADAESCMEWHPGIPIDLASIRDQDETYWDLYRGTPKAFIALATAQELWSNKYGELTAIRFNDPAPRWPQLHDEINAALTEGSWGLTFEPVLQNAVSASEASVDFGQLFIGLSFFIIVAAGLLTTLLFIFNTDQRRDETGQLQALGFLPTQIRNLRLAEGLTLSLLGGVLGAVIGIQYSRFILYGLGSFWRDAVGFSDFTLQVNAANIAIGVIAGFLLSFVTIWIVIRRQSRQHLSLAETASIRDPAGWGRRRGKHIAVLILVTLALLSLLWKHYADGHAGLAVFYTAAILLLFLGLYACTFVMHEIRHRANVDRFGLSSVILQNWSRRSGRNLATISLLVLGIFIVVSVGLNHQDPTRDSQDRRSGTGGFDLFIETTLPVLDDQTMRAGQGSASASSPLDPEIVKFRKRSGDDGSCLNLNMVQQPQILGVSPALLQDRFNFIRLLEDLPGSSGWDVLEQDFGDGVVPAVADMSVIQWGFGLGLGDTLFYEDDAGARLAMVLVGGLANSVFQGHVIIAERDFERYFPSRNGYSVFLADTPDPAAVTRQLEISLHDLGPLIGGTGERLVVFGAVQNTYLSIFLMLGSLGLLIGTFGLGAVVLRTLLESRWELALLQAVGYTRKRVGWIIYSEQLLNLLPGLFIGSLAAIISILPVLTHADAGQALTFVLILAGVMLVNGSFWIALALRSSFKRDITAPLQSE